MEYILASLKYDELYFENYYVQCVFGYGGINNLNYNLKIETVPTLIIFLYKRVHILFGILHYKMNTFSLCVINNITGVHIILLMACI
jgi:hypothetical protein